jgi:hypothetical protein
MSKFVTIMKKYTLVALVFTLGLLAVPPSIVTATSLDASPTLQANPVTNDVRIEQAWVRTQNAYHRQDKRLDKAIALVDRIQSLIEKANQKGWDTSSLQASLDAFSDAIPDAQSAHASGTAIISSHNGFDINGKITDRGAAITSVKGLVEVLKDTREIMNGTGHDLRDALIAFRNTHKPIQTLSAP